MKKNLLFCIVALLVMSVLPAKAQVESFTDLFGKYHFTADMTITEYGQQYADLISDDCEVTLTASTNSYYTAMITGVAGSGEVHIGSTFSYENQRFKIVNPNYNYSAFGGKLHFSWYEGTYPYSVYPADSTHVSYNDIYYYWNDEEQYLTLDSFSIVTVDYSAQTAQIVAQFKNIKMELVEKEFVEIADLSGEWTYSNSSYSFIMELEKTDDTNKYYDAKLFFEDYDTVHIAGTFDGVTYSMAFDSLYLDNENGIRFGTKLYAYGTMTFTLASENLLTQGKNIYITQDSTETKECEILHTLYGGYAKRESDEVVDTTWDGTYTVTADVVVNDESYGEWPETFEMVVEYNEIMDKYYLKEFLGFDVYTMNQGGTDLEISDDGKTATLSMTAYFGYGTYIKSFGGGVFLQMFDGLGEMNDIEFTLNNDGTVTIPSFLIQLTDFAGSEPVAVAYYQNITAVKQVKEFDWLDTFTLTADVEVLNDASYPSSFLVTIAYNETNNITNITSFMGCDVYSYNYGSNKFIISDDTQSATYTTGTLVGGSYPDYLKIFAKDGSTTALNFTVNDDETVSVDDFCFYTFNWDTGDLNKVAVYTNVVLTRGDTTGIVEVAATTTANVTGIYDLSGRCIEQITAPGIYIVNGKKVVVK